LKRGVDAQGHVVVKAAYPKIGAVHWVDDPETGERIAIVTGRAPARGLVKSQSFVDFKALATAQGLAVAPRATADSHFALFAMVHSGAFATIVPDGYARFMAGVEWARFVPFDAPEEARRVGLVVINRDPIGPMARAALAAARLLEPMGIHPAL
jgi:DNA-binding transcriptional LysR family regulator